MKLLREYIRVLLSEGAKGVADLPPQAYVSVEKLSDGINIYYADMFGGQLEKPISGIIEAYEPDETTGNCEGALVVRRAFATKGFGPLLYDLMLEAAGDRGLTMDRETLSPAALRVWEYYMLNRSDVTKRQTTENECKIGPDIAKHLDKYDTGKSPLHYIYVKNDNVVTQQLLSMGKMI